MDTPPWRAWGGQGQRHKRAVPRPPLPNPTSSTPYTGGGHHTPPPPPPPTDTSLHQATACPYDLPVPLPGGVDAGALLAFFALRRTRRRRRVSGRGCIGVEQLGPCPNAHPGLPPHTSPFHRPQPPMAHAVSPVTFSSRHGPTNPRVSPRFHLSAHRRRRTPTHAAAAATPRPPSPSLSRPHRTTAAQPT
ncbi:hypothetical protein ZWY2020_012900 [Hordeum vulgare]|nr:hypothetical protein ZWY2020_012900 [Hordeum vulgare]